jgi:Ca2+-binding RTX toxin-like protein
MTGTYYTRDGFVSGTSGNDTIKSGYTDADGDKIDNNDAILPGENGNDDIVIAGAGNDKVESLAGNDEVYGGGGRDTIDAGHGNDVVYGDSTRPDAPSGTTSTVTKTIDFNELSKGTFVDNEYVADGLTISSHSANHKPMIFDSKNPTGGDWDLHTHSLHKVLIISEDNDQSDPDDNATGGTLTFTFDEPVTFNKMTFLDMEEKSYVKFYDEAGNQIGSTKTIWTADGKYCTKTFNVENVAKMTVTMNASGAVDNLVYTQTVTTDPIDGGLPAGDSILGGYGNDTIYGEDGNDTLDGGHDHDVVYGGIGNDRITNAGGNDQMYGDEGNDSMYGGAHDDDMYGGVGDDSMRGQGGSDEMHGASGDDHMYGHAGADSIFAGAGNDDIEGGSEHDLIFGGSGKDTIDGQSHNDTIYGNADDDSLIGGTGNDVIYGDDGNGGGEAGGRESFEWDKAPDPNSSGGIDNNDPLSSFTQDTGAVNVKFTATTITNSPSSKFVTDPQKVHSIDTAGPESANPNSTLESR